MDIVWLVSFVTFFLGMGIGFYIMKYKSHSMLSNLQILQAFQIDLQEKLTQTERNLTQITHEKITLSEQKNYLSQDNHKLNEDLLKKEKEASELQDRFYHYQNEMNKDLITLRERNEALTKEMASKNEEFLLLQKQSEIQFKNIANQIFEQKSEIFQKQSSQNLETLLMPMKETFGDFKQKISDVMGKHRDEQISLKTEIANIQKLNQTMSEQTQNLTKALKGDNKTQGDWGEMILERLLEEAGLEKDINFTTQASGLDLKHPETGKIQKPDVILHLPDQKHIIIDSKVSLKHYEAMISASSDLQKEEFNGLFIKSIQGHIKDLASKEYAKNKSLDTPDIVLMFIPIEGAYHHDLITDTTLHQFAWNNRIALVSTTTLFATLKTISSIWKIEKQNKNSEKIADEASKIYDKIFSFLSDMEKIGDSLQKSQKSYEDAWKKLCTGNGNILKKTEEIKQLGINPKKDIKDIKMVAQELEDAS